MPVEPALLAEVHYATRTADGLLADSCRGAEGRASLQRKLCVLPAKALFDDSVRPYILCRGNLVLMRGYIEAIQDRAECIAAVRSPRY